MANVARFATQEDIELGKAQVVSIDKDGLAHPADQPAKAAPADQPKKVNKEREATLPGYLLFTLPQLVAYSERFGEPKSLEIVSKQLGLENGAMLENRMLSAWRFGLDVEAGRAKANDEAAPFIGLTDEELATCRSLHLVSFDPTMERVVTPSALLAGWLARNQDGSVLVGQPHKIVARFRWSIGAKVADSFAPILAKSRRSVSVQTAGQVARELAAVALREAGARLDWSALDSISARVLELAASLAAEAKARQ